MQAASSRAAVGGLTALQQGAVLASVPFTFVLVRITWCLVRALREEDLPSRPPARAGPLRTASPGPVPDKS